MVIKREERLVATTIELEQSRGAMKMIMMMIDDDDNDNDDGGGEGVGWPTPLLPVSAVQ